MFFSNRKIKALKTRVAELERELAECRNALAFYANEASWLEGMKYRDAEDSTVFTDSTISAVMHDKGHRARAVLRDERSAMPEVTQFRDKTEFKE